MLLLSLIRCAGRQLSALPRNRRLFGRAPEVEVYSGVKLRYLVRNQFRTCLNPPRFQGAAELLEVICCATKIILTY